MISEEDTDKHLAEILDILKERFEAGDKSALLYAIYHCLLLTARKAGKCTVIEIDELRRWVRSLPVRGRVPDSESAA